MHHKTLTMMMLHRMTSLGHNAGLRLWWKK